MHPSSDKDRQKYLNNIVKWNLNRNIICGDFNNIVCPDDQPLSTNFKLKRSAKIILNKAKRHNMDDIWQKLNPDAIDFTFTHTANKTIKRRLDRIYVSNDLGPYFLEVVSLPTDISDHKYLLWSTRNKQSPTSKLILPRKVKHIKALTTKLEDIAIENISPVAKYSKAISTITQFSDNYSRKRGWHLPKKIKKLILI